MSVATRNPFALLNDDEVGETAPVAAPPPPAPEPKAAPKEQKAKSGPASRGGRYYQRGGGAKNASRDTQENDADATPRESRKAEGEVRGRGRGGRGARGGRGGPGAGRGRQYDRHSGTLPDSDKKVSQGWGANEGNAELNAEQQGDADAAKDATVEKWGVDNAAAADSWGAAAPAAEGDAWGGAAATGDGAESKDANAATPANGTRRTGSKDKEEEDNSLTFDEYLAQKAKSDAVAVPKIEAMRKANEGVDESLWKDTVPLAKGKAEDNYFVGKTKSAPKARAKKEEKVHIEIDARFERPARGGVRGGRGGRGGHGGERGGDRGFRGSGPRGGARPSGPTPRNATRDVDVDDKSAFPSLA